MVNSCLTRNSILGSDRDSDLLPKSFIFQRAQILSQIPVLACHLLRGPVGIAVKPVANWNSRFKTREENSWHAWNLAPRTCLDESGEACEKVGFTLSLVSPQQG